MSSAAWAFSSAVNDRPRPRAIRDLATSMLRLHARGQAEARVAQLLLQDGDAGSRVALLALVQRRRGRGVRHWRARRGLAEVAAIGVGKLAAIGRVVGPRLQGQDEAKGLCRQEEAEAGARKFDRHAEVLPVGDGGGKPSTAGEVLATLDEAF